MAKKINNPKKNKGQHPAVNKVKTAEKRPLKSKDIKAVKPARKKLGKGLEDISNLFLSEVKKDSLTAKKKAVKSRVKKGLNTPEQNIKASAAKKNIKTSAAKKRIIAKAVEKPAGKIKKIIPALSVKVLEEAVLGNTIIPKKTSAKAVKKSTVKIKETFSENNMPKAVEKKAVFKEIVSKKTVAEIAEKAAVVKDSIIGKVSSRISGILTGIKDDVSKKTTALSDKKTAKRIIEKDSEKVAVEKLEAKQASSKPSMEKTEVVRMGTFKKSSNEDKQPAQAKPTVKKTVKSKTVADEKESKKTQGLGPISELKTFFKKKNNAKSAVDGQNIQNEQVIEDSKFFVSKEPVNRIQEEEFFDLPEGYGDNRIIIQVRDPYWLFAYWEISQRKLNSVIEKYGNDINNAKKVLRVYDITAVAFNGHNANSFFDIEINELAKNWYVNVGNPGRSYCIDIGLVLPDGRFVVLARSNFVTTPIDAPSMVTDEEWMIVEDDFNKLYGLSAGLGIGLSSGELRKQIKTRLQNLSSGILSSPAVTTVNPRRSFWMVVNTELIVYGATQPGSELTVQGKPITLNEDGTFSLRFALPDGEQIIPVRAVSPDKVEERVITPVVSKNTV